MNVYAKRVTVFAALLVAGCGGRSAGFDPLPADPPPAAEPPPAEPPSLEVEPAFINLSFNSPLALLQAPQDPSRWFVVEKAGIVREFPAVPDASVDDLSVFVDIADRVDSTPSEGGLLGMAFHPDFTMNGEVYLSYTRSMAGLESVVSRFFLDPVDGTLDATSEEILLIVSQHAPNHNGGNIAFGPDGFLYVGFGDGGGAGDPEENGQDTTNLLGAILRVDVDSAFPYAIPGDNPFAGNTECFQGVGTGNCPEILAWGFRNPWRFSFDRLTGDLWVGDVGQNSWEEIDRVELSGNYGWNNREGAHCFDPPTGCDTDSIDPITEYSHDVGNSVTGGYVYRGGDFPDLEGFYVFGDFDSGRIWAVAAASAQRADPTELADTPLRIVSFAEDSDGELYLLHFSGGTVHRLVAD